MRHIYLPASIIRRFFFHLVGLFSNFAYNYLILQLVNYTKRTTYLRSTGRDPLARLPANLPRKHATGTFKIRYLPTCNRTFGNNFNDDGADMAYLDFQARFQQLEAHRDLSNGLIRDILQHYTSLEAHLQKENQRLTSQLDDTLLELEDARKSRRDLQRELGLANQTINRFNLSYDTFIVGGRKPRGLRCGWS